MNILHKVVNAMTGQNHQQTSSRRRQVRYQGAIETLEQRTSLSQVHSIMAIAPAILVTNGPQLISSSNPVSPPTPTDGTTGQSGKVEPKDPGGVELAVVAAPAATANNAVGYAQQPTVQVVGPGSGAHANARS